jgi:hypothetical protein
MSLPGPSSNCETGSSATIDLPLFRTEAIDAQRQRFYGDIILIRPFSHTLLVLLGIFFGSIVLGFIIFGRYTERAHVSGILAANSASNDREALAILYIPARAFPFVRLGERLIVHCSSCMQDLRRGVVETVSAAPLEPSAISRESGLGSERALYRITVAIDHGNALPPAAKIEADISLNRISIWKWLFESPTS